MARGGKVGRLNQGFGRTPLKAIQVHVGGKFDLVLLKAVMNVSMYKLGGSRPQGLYKGPPTTLTTHTT